MACAQHSPGDAAHDSPLDARASVGSHNDQVSVTDVRSRGDALWCISDSHVDGHIDARVCAAKQTSGSLQILGPASRVRSPSARPGTPVRAHAHRAPGGRAQPPQSPVAVGHGLQRSRARLARRFRQRPSRRVAPARVQSMDPVAGHWPGPAGRSPKTRAHDCWPGAIRPHCPCTRCASPVRP